MRAMRWISSPLWAPLGVILLTAPLGAAWAQVSGTVRDGATGQPIAEALVQVQAGGERTHTDASGRYRLESPTPGTRITAAAVGYFNAGQDAPASGSADFALEVVPLDETSQLELASPTACLSCHEDQVREWRDSAMAHAGTNTWVHDMYAGNGTPDGMGGFVYTRDSVHAEKNPESDCAACHQPERWIDEPFTEMRPADSTHPTVTRGVSCLTCHLMAHVDETKPNIPGLYPGAVTINRSEIVRYGTLGDVDYHAPGRMRASYQPQMGAVVCAVCHQDAADPKQDGSFDGPLSEPTYLEWLNSPYGDPQDERYETCMQCHSQARQATSASHNLPLTAPRPIGQLRTHTFEGTTAEFLEKAVRLDVQTAVEGDELHVTVRLENHGTGHHVPTGVTIRNMILLVEAEGAQGALEHLGDQRIDKEGGEGDPKRGYYAGQPGKVYAKFNEDAQGFGPTLFSEAVRIRKDTRLAALQTDVTRYRFRLQGEAPVQVKARVIYRRAWRSLVDAKKWTTTGQGDPLPDISPPHYGHLMAQAQVAVDPATAPAPDAGAEVQPDVGPSAQPDAGAPSKGSSGGCSSAPSGAPAGAWALLLGAWALRRRRSGAAIKKGRD